MSVIAIPWKTKTKIMINNNYTLSSTYNKRNKTFEDQSYRTQNVKSKLCPLLCFENIS